MQSWTAWLAWEQLQRPKAIGARECQLNRNVCRCEVESQSCSPGPSGQNERWWQRCMPVCTMLVANRQSKIGGHEAQNG